MISLFQAGLLEYLVHKAGPKVFLGMGNAHMCAGDRIEVNMVRAFDVSEFPAGGLKFPGQIGTVHGVYYTHCSK